MNDNKLYTVRMIHRLLDWDASVTFAAPSARQARTWAPRKMANPKDWLIVSAKRVVIAKEKA